jgi:hypothetical protein
MTGMKVALRLCERRFIMLVALFSTVLTLGLAGASPALGAPQAANVGPERFTAFAVDMSNTARTGNNSTTVDIVVNRWSSDADRDRLLNILKTKGQDALLSALQSLPVVGYITTPGSLRYDLHFARQHPEAEGGRTVVLATDRYITGWEARNRPRTIDYPFTLIQLQLDREDHGIGKLSIATKITAKGDTIELENFSSEPVRLTEVKKEKTH